jgi:mRNA interferase RelE/StbE
VTLAVVYERTAVTAMGRLRRADKEAFARAGRAIAGLADEPRPAGSVPWGSKGIYRLHAGDLRILYEVDEEAGAVYVRSVGLVS